MPNNRQSYFVPYKLDLLAVIMLNPMFVFQINDILKINMHFCVVITIFIWSNLHPHSGRKILLFSHFFFFSWKDRLYCIIQCICVCGHMSVHECQWIDLHVPLPRNRMSETV